MARSKSSRVAETIGADRPDRRMLNDFEFQAFACSRAVHQRVTVDVHGKPVDQIEPIVMKALSDAIMKNVDQIEIVHGYRGGSLLRNEVHRLLGELRARRYIEQFAVGNLNPGHTIVRL